MLLSAEGSAHKHAYAAPSWVEWERWPRAGEDLVMADDCLLYKCSFYDQGPSVVLVLVEVVEGHVMK